MVDDICYGSFTLPETDSGTDSDSFGFRSYTETGRRDPSPSLCNVNMFCMVQHSHRVWKPNLSLYLSPSPSMRMNHYVNILIAGH